MSAPTNNFRPKILAIDDEVKLLDVMKEVLEDEGFEVLTSATAAGGLELYEREWRDIRLVLIDYLMPEMNGDVVFDLMQRVNPDVRALLVTACDDHVAKGMFERGLRGFMSKPFYVDDLIRRVRDEVEAV
jgi:DNA-binding NtrC family response regulator